MIAVDVSQVLGQKSKAIKPLTGSLRHSILAGGDLW